MRVIKNNHELRLKKELITVLTVGFFTSILIVTMGIMAVLFMVERGWIQ
jgi:hypothetical protein